MQTRHLLYHLCPFAHNQVWRENVALLRRRLDLFNGRRRVAICTGDGLEKAEAVREAFGAERVEFVEVPNEPRLREVATFLPLFEPFDGLGEGHAILWSHAKGVQTVYTEQVRLWREALYTLYLDHWPTVAGLLEQFPVVGAFKKLGRGWPPQESSSEWHYSGSWAWYRAADLFALADWRRIDSFWAGIEPYPSLHFRTEQAGCIFHQDAVPRMNLYNLGYWRSVVSPALERWLKEHAAAQPAAVRVELGGGSKARPGFLNVDLCDGADVKLDLQAVCNGTAVLPWADGEVGEVYSSHCIEHLSELKRLLWEICRVCRAGSPVEIRVPHWNQSMALVDGHRHTWSETAVKQVCETCVPHWWQGSPKRLKLLRAEKQPGERHQQALRIFGRLGMSAGDVMDLIPDTCHEVRYFFEVIPNA